MNSYNLSAPDCDAFYFDGAEEEMFCSLCDSYIASEKYYPKKLQIGKPKYDFSFPYEGPLLLSEKAKLFLEQIPGINIQFKQVNPKPKRYVPVIKNEIVFNSLKGEVRFENKCNECGNYESIVGSIPPYLTDEEKISPLNMYVTDLHFGSGREKFPSYIVGDELGHMLKKEFKEILLDKVLV